MEFWCNVGTVNNTIIQKSDGATAPGWMVAVTTSLMRLQTGDGSNHIRQTTAGTSGWHHYVLTRGAAATGNVYVDGVADTNVSAAKTFTNNASDVVVGPDGGIFGLVLYSRVITQPEAMAMASFAYGSAPPPAASAEGFGSVATGGAGLTSYVVTTTADSGAGSLRDALSAGSRYITFSCSGTITLATQLNPTGNAITVDGTTSPTGIKLAGAPIFWSGNSNVIVKGLRFRDQTLPATADSMTLKDGCTNFLIDHCSFSGADDGSLDITLDCSDVTVQWCFLGPQKVGIEGHTSQIARSTENVTVHHNLFYEGHTRHPQCGDGDNAYEPGTTLQGDIRCNLIWAPTQGLYGTLITAGAVANVVRNYYYLSVVGANRNVHTETTGSAYSAENYDRSGGSTATTTPHTEMPIPGFATVTMEATALLAAVAVLAGAGCRTNGLDATDQAIVNAINAAGL